MTTAIEAGSPAPGFTAPTNDGGSLSLDGLRGKAVVLYFYPRDDTPGCTREAQEFTEALPAFAAAGAEIVGVSKDTAAKHDKFRAKYGLPFTLVSDARTATSASATASGSRRRIMARPTWGSSARPSSSLPTAPSARSGAR